MKELLWGIYDTKHRVWMGDANGLLLYDDYVAARVAALNCDRCVGHTLGQCRARPYTDGDTAQFYGTVIVRMGATEQKE